MNIVYVLINEAMPGYVKVGQTENLCERLKQLYSTPVPLPFEVFYACTVKENAKEVEQWILEIFAESRVSKRREFLTLPPERVRTALQARAVEDVTPKEIYTESEEDEAALNEARTNRDKLNFKMVDIPTGAELTFSGNESVKATVVNNRDIEYESEVTSLSKSAQRILGYNYSVAGTRYWMYKGETLDERRRRMESEE